jgi:hypothetical protein
LRVLLHKPWNRAIRTNVAEQDMDWTRAEPGYVPPELDITKPSVARVYDAILGRKVQVLHTP